VSEAAASRPELAAEAADQSDQLARAQDLPVGDVCDVTPAEEGEEVMFAERKKVNVFDDDHLVVLDRVERAVQEMVDVLLVAPGHELQRLLDPFRSLEQAVPVGIFAQMSAQILGAAGSTASGRAT
jgi:hypothetical protein